MRLEFDNRLTAIIALERVPHLLKRLLPTFTYRVEGLGVRFVLPDDDRGVNAVLR